MSDDSSHKCLTCRRFFKEFDLEVLACVPICVDCLLNYTTALLVRMKTIRLIPSVTKKD